ncbi:hypothetical protein BH18ACI5_BH18ACI5_26660 [soil metagenome]
MVSAATMRECRRAAHTVYVRPEHVHRLLSVPPHLSPGRLAQRLHWTRRKR